MNKKNKLKQILKIQNKKLINKNKNKMIFKSKR